MVIYITVNILTKNALKADNMANICFYNNKDKK